MQIIFLFLSALITGVLLWLGFPMMPLTPLLFVAFVPLLNALSKLQSLPNKNWWRFAAIYFAMLVWNICSTWWVWNASAGGASAAIILNALLQSFPIMLFYFLEEKNSSRLKWLMLPVFWLAFEKIHLTWEFTWPWLTIGNGFATHPEWVQWYQFTGHLGGSAWVWCCNISLFLAIYQNKNKPFFSRWIAPLAAIAVPLLFSFMVQMKNSFSVASCKTATVPFLLIQPNIDPYNEKFVDGNSENQVEKFIQLAEQNLTDTVKPIFIALPETALPTGIWWQSINHDAQIILLKQFLHRHPNVKLITGATITEEYNFAKTPTAYEQPEHSNHFFDDFNTALLLDTSNAVQKYYKSKLVPGVERMPYPGFFKFLKPLLIDMGGASQNNGTQATRTILNANGIGIAPMICYESIYGSYCTEFVKNGANILLIITNDGWWGNTPGHRQHFEFARLRAIETHRMVLQCANTGISGVIDENGNVLQKTEYWKPAVVKCAATCFGNQTFFVQFGNQMEWAIVALAVGFILVGLFFKTKLK